MNFTLQKQNQWQRVLGIDYSNQSLKYVMVKRSVRGIKIDCFGKYSFKSDDTESELDKALNHLLKDNKYLKKAKIVIGLDDNDVVIKTESFPNLSRKEISQSIQFALQQEISQEGIETEIISDFRPVAALNKSDYITMGAPEDVVVNKVGAIVAQETTPSKVIPSIVSLLNLLQFIPGIEEMGEIGLLDIGATRSMLIFVKNGKIDFYREILVGGDDFTKGITGTIFHEGRAIQLISDEAVEFKMKFGYPQEYSEGSTFRGAPVSEIGTMMRPVVERLIGEIKRSIGFFKDKSEGGDINRLYLLGGGAQLKNLPDVLSEKLELSVFALPFPQDIQVSGKKEQKDIFKTKYLEQAVSFSLALEDSPEGNLLPDIYKKIHQTSTLKRYALMFIGLFACILLIFWWMREKEIDILETKVVSHQKRISDIKEAESNAQQLTVLQKREAELRSQITELKSSYGQDETLIQILRLVSHITPKDCMVLSYDYGIREISKDEDKPGTKNKKENQEDTMNKVVTLYLSYPEAPKDVEIIAFKYIVDLEESGLFSDVNLTTMSQERSKFLSDIKDKIPVERANVSSGLDQNQNLEEYFSNENMFMFRIDAIVNE